MDVIVQTNNKVDARCTPGRGEVRTGESRVLPYAVCDAEGGRSECAGPGTVRAVEEARHAGYGTCGPSLRRERYVGRIPCGGDVCLQGR